MNFFDALDYCFPYVIYLRHKTNMYLEFQCVVLMEGVQKKGVLLH